MELTGPIPLRKVKSVGRGHGQSPMVHVLECGHEAPIYTVSDRDRQRRRCYECWRKEPIPTS
jgi:hypothetical protein